MKLTESPMKSVSAILLIGMALGGCASKPFGGSPDVKVMTPAVLPEPTQGDIYAPERTYLIGPFDKLRIDVYGIPELSQRLVQVDASGRISFPLVGIVEASGKTPNEVQTFIEHALRGQSIRNPQVTVNLEETVNRVVTVYGEVREPGLYPVVGRMTLLRAIATAKGLAEYATEDGVVIFRTVDGQKMAALYNLASIRRGAYPDPEIFANDVVVVSDSATRKLFRSITDAATLITTPLIVLLQR